MEDFWIFTFYNLNIHKEVKCLDSMLKNSLFTNWVIYIYHGQAPPLFQDYPQIAVCDLDKNLTSFKKPTKAQSWLNFPIFFTCLFVYNSRYNSWIDRPKFCLGPNMTHGRFMDGQKMLSDRTTKFKVEIKDGRKTPWKPSNNITKDRGTQSCIV